MPYFVGLDGSKKTTSICVMDRKGAIVREGEVATEPKAITSFLRGQGARYALVGMEEWTMSSWLRDGLARARLPVICIEGRHAHGVLKARAHKTDRTDARGIADLLRTGTYRPVHRKSEASRQIKALLTARQLLATKALGMENAIRGLLMNLGFTLGARLRRAFGDVVTRLVRRNEFAWGLVAPLLELCAKLRDQARELERRLTAIAKGDEACRVLTTAPGVGPLTALAYRSVIDDPNRFARSRSVGPLLGLVPRVRQSGETERRGRITKAGDHMLRSGLYMAAIVILRRGGRESWLRAWGETVAARRGKKRAFIAVARRLAVVLHRMWVTGASFRAEPTHR